MIHPTLLQSSSYFHNSYDQARQAWRQKVSDCLPLLRQQGWPKAEDGSIVHPLAGPDGESLATDLLWLGDRNAAKVGILLSATHGIEGYVGNAVQGFLLDLLLDQDATVNNRAVKDNVALLFVHALNPWGMAWKRRCDENGVDLNRNYIDFANPPENSGYQLLQSSLTIADRADRQRVLSQAATSFGKTEYEIALSGGQFSDPAGPFYGGSAAAHGHKVCLDLVKRYDLQQRQLVVIDIHSGLGAWSYGELISDHPLGNANDCFAQAIFGPGVTNPARGDSSSVAKYGLQDYFWHKLMTAEGCYLTLEFGTYSTQDLFDVIVDDHRLWRDNLHQANKNPGTPAIKQQQQDMLEHFCPADPYWRQLVLIQAAQVMSRLLKGLQYKQ